MSNTDSFWSIRQTWCMWASTPNPQKHFFLTFASCRLTNVYPHSDGRLLTRRQWCKKHFSFWLSSLWLFSWVSPRDEQNGPLLMAPWLFVDYRVAKLRIWIYYKWIKWIMQKIKHNCYAYEIRFARCCVWHRELWHAVQLTDQSGFTRRGLWGGWNHCG